MKTKINYKKGILLFTVVSMLFGCNINLIPTVVNKDVSLGLFTIANQENKDAFWEPVTLDLSSFLDDDELDDIESAVIKKFTVKLNSDYENTATLSKDLEGSLRFYIVKEGIAFNSGTFHQHDLVAIAPFITLFKNEVELELEPSDKSYSIKDVIKDKKVKLGVVVGTDAINTYFNDNFFSFTLKVEAEVQLEL